MCVFLVQHVRRVCLVRGVQRCAPVSTEVPVTQWMAAVSAQLATREPTVLNVRVP